VRHWKRLGTPYVRLFHVRPQTKHGIAYGRESLATGGPVVFAVATARQEAGKAAPPGPRGQVNEHF